MEKKWSLAVGLMVVLSWAVPGFAAWFSDDFTEWRVSDVVWQKDSPSTTLPLIDYSNAYMVVGADGHGTGYSTVADNGYAWLSGVATFWVKDWGSGAVFGVTSVSGGLDLGYRNDVNDTHYATAYINGTWNQDPSWQWPAYWDGTIASVAQIIWDNEAGTVTFRFYNNTGHTLAPGVLPTTWQGEATYTFTPTNAPMRIFTYAYGGPFTYFEYVRAAPAKVTVQGSVALQGYQGDNSTLGVKFDFTPVSGGSATSRTMLLNADGSFSLDNISVGTYDIVVKSSTSLATMLDNITISDAITDLGVIELKNADSNGDNRVSFEDFSLLQNNYGQSGLAADGPLAAAATGGCGALGLALLALTGVSLLYLKNQE